MEWHDTGGLKIIGRTFMQGTEEGYCVRSI